MKTKFLKHLSKHSRCGDHGTEIQCPKCKQINTIYHMAWSAITCQNCTAMIDKYEWRFVKQIPKPEPVEFTYDELAIIYQMAMVNDEPGIANKVLPMAEQQFPVVKKYKLALVAPRSGEKTKAQLRTKSFLFGDMSEHEVNQIEEWNEKTADEQEAEHAKYLAGFDDEPTGKIH